MIKTLQSLRGMAILMIFLSHLSFFENSDYAFIYKLLFFSGGAGGVSVFIILSGFVITINYYNKTKDFKFANAKKFTLKRMRHFYVLHLLTLFLAVPFLIAVTLKNHDLIVNNLLKFILNVFLLQSYVPIQGVYFSLNAVTWYLSTSLFFYICTFSIFNILHKIQTAGGCLLALGAIYGFEIAYVMLFKNISTAHYWIYISPFFRIFDYFIGCILGKLYLDGESQYCNKAISWMEIWIASIWIALYTNCYQMNEGLRMGVYLRRFLQE